MSTETEHNEHSDLFSLKVKQKLENHRLPVDMECWEQIEAKVTERSRHSVWRVGGWISAVAAVIALLLVIRLYQPAQTQENGQIAEKTNLEQMDTERLQPDKGSTYAIPPQAREQAVARVTRKERVVPVLVDTIIVGETFGEEGEVELPAQAETVQQPVVKTSDVRRQGPEPEKRRAGNLVAMADRPKAKGGKWQIGANMGTGGHISLGMGLDNSHQDEISNDPLAPGLPLPPIPPVDDNTDLNMSGGLATFSHVDCAPPLSFGLTVRKNLSGRVGLESGLVYTYLYSKLSQSRTVSRRATLGLHYLGIPVNLVIKLWDDPNWNVYVSGGFMMEKGLRSIYHVEAYSLNEPKSATSRSGIDGLQWSLNLSVGVSYRLYRDWSLYLEPRYSYYFDNDQPVSYRTENMTLIGVGAGIRFEF